MTQTNAQQLANFSRDLGRSLKKITNNLDGGKVVIKDEISGKTLITFIMPEKSKRKPLDKAGKK